MDFKRPEDFKYKKDLKNYVNQKGGFVKMMLNNVQDPKAKDFDKEAIPARYREKVPQDAIYFEGIASNGDLNMNGYIIRPEAWTPAVNQYMEDFGGKVYYQHDMGKPIGQTLEAYVDGNSLIVHGYVFDDTHSQGEIRRGLTTDLSTGHYTLATEFENANTGEVITNEEFEETA